MALRPQSRQQGVVTRGVLDDALKKQRKTLETGEVILPERGIVPTGTGFRHISTGVEDAAAKLVDTADVNNDQITNAKLANMAAHTFKGRKTASTGDPEDLTATEATAELNAFVGDTGTGGTKGLVPAPAAGDAAKFLKGDGAWGTPAGGGSAAPVPTLVYFVDDFIGGNVTSGNVGQLGWVQGGPNNPTVIASVANHPGLINSSTGATINSVQNLALSRNSSASGVIDPADTFDMIFIFRLNTNDANTIMRCGLAMNSTVDPFVDGIFIEKKAADTQWFGVTRAASAETRTASLGNVSTNFVKMRIRRISGTTIGFTVDAGTELTLTATIPTVFLTIFIHCKNTAAAAKNFDIDYFQMALTVNR